MPDIRALGFAILFIAAVNGPGEAVAANQLGGHPSPYLRLHADDPVDWRSWQADVFADAAADNRLVLISVGYFSCHWCHVMQRESYRDDAVAKMLNAKYIPVKIDRELNPELDQRMINFVERVRGSAGWPLNVFLTPGGYPLTGFTYLPRDDFLRVLHRLDAEWQADHVRITRAAEEFFRQQMQDEFNLAFEAPDVPAEKLVDAFVAQSMLAADELQGGFGNTSKFPSVPQLEALLDAIAMHGPLDADVPDFVQLTLGMMASGNLADHVNGGFYRYTTDPDWQTPHFEKMLYDNAQLASLYLKAQRLWPNRGYADIALRTLEFIETGLRHPGGGYMSSLSAVDADNIEGGAYWWNREQLAALLTADEFRYLEQTWQLQASSENFLLPPLLGAAARGEPQTNRAILHKLRAHGRSPMPADDKRLASWNAMLLDAFTAAADFDQGYAERASELFAQMRKRFYRDGALLRLADNAAVATPVLEDYARVARAFYRYGKRFKVAGATELAAQLTGRAQALFLRDGRWQQQADSLIPVAQGKWILPDLVAPSPMTLWLEVALDVPGLDPEVKASATAMLRRVTREMVDSPYFYGSFIMLRARHAERVKNPA